MKGEIMRVAAVIIKDGKVLLMKRNRENVVYWVIPGGAIERGETNEEAVVRECKEELGVDVKVMKLIFSFRNKFKGYARPSDQAHTSPSKGVNEFYYLCEIVEGKLGTGDGQEYQKGSGYVGSYDIEWREIKDLNKINLKPEEIKDFIYEKYQSRSSY